MCGFFQVLLVMHPMYGKGLGVLDFFLCGELNKNICYGSQCHYTCLALFFDTRQYMSVARVFAVGFTVLPQLLMSKTVP